MAEPSPERVKRYTQALSRVKKAQPALYQDIVQKFVNSGYTYSGPVVSAVQQIKSASDRGIVVEFMQDKTTINYMLNTLAGDVSKKFGEGFGEIVEKGAAKAEAEKGKLGDAIAGGLSNALTPANILAQIYKMGIGAGVGALAIVFIILGIIILLRAPLTKAASKIPVVKAVT